MFDSASKAPWQPILVVLLLLGCGSLATAQIRNEFEDVDTAGLVIEATAGWDGYVDTQSPVPISLFMENFSEEAIEGKLFLLGPFDDRELDLGEVFIGPGSKRRFSAIRGDVQDFYQCHAEIRNENNRVLWRRELILNSGKTFADDAIYVLLIDDARSLRLPAYAKNKQLASNGAVTIDGISVASGRSVRSLTAKTWQVPSHSGVLSVVHSIVLANDMDVKSLNRAQWNAIANWMCEGGTIFVHDKSKEVIQQLIEDAPLSSSARMSSDDGFMVREIGLGRICEYSEPVFSSAGKEVRQQIANMLAVMPNTSIRTLAKNGQIDRVSGRSDWNRFLMLGFFGLYTILSGVVTILLFRLSRKQIATYTVAVVATFCIAAVVLGGALRFSSGDVHWLSITQPCEGGFLQVARLEATSAGARATKLAVTGDNVDLQAANTRNRWRWSNTQHGRNFPAFTWQPDMDKENEDNYQVNVAMTPWGERYLHATAFKPGEEARLKFSVEYKPRLPDETIDDEDEESHSEDQETPTTTPQGEITIKIKNNLPFDLVDCFLRIGVTAPYDSNVANLLARQQPWRNQPTSIGDKIDVYHEERIRNLPAGAEQTITYASNFRMKTQWDNQARWQPRRELMRETPSGWIPAPRLHRIGTANAWIMGRMDKSPSIEVDEANSSFTANDGLHIYVQEIRPEDMADASKFFEKQTDED